MADSDRIVSAVAALITSNSSAYNQTILVVTGATVTISPGPARLAAIYAASSTTGTTSVQGFKAENGSAVSFTIASGISGMVLYPPRPMYVASIAVATNTAADARKFLFVWQSANNG